MAKPDDEDKFWGDRLGTLGMEMNLMETYSLTN